MPGRLATAATIRHDPALAHSPVLPQDAELTLALVQVQPYRIHRRLASRLGFEPVRCLVHRVERNTATTSSRGGPAAASFQLTPALTGNEPSSNRPVAVTSVFDFDSSEHYQALRAVSRRTAARWVSWGFGGLALVLALLSLRDGWGRASPLALFLNALPWLLLGMFWVAFIPISQRWAARSLPKRDASVRGPQERTVDSDGFHSRGNGVSLDVPWHAMLRGVETNDFFLFFYSKQVAYYVPKRVLADGQIREVRRLMRTELGERARLLTD
jgi:hypothetical protein